MKKIKKQVIKSDFNRVVLTETAPYELPLIISNEGFYKRINKFNEIKSDNNSTYLFKVIERLFINRDEPKLPFTYEIIKNSTQSRLLSLLHPASQLRVIEFYKDYSSLILEFCSKSPLSLRYPSNYASSYYIYDNKNISNKYRSEEVESSKNSFYNEYASSFFSYSHFSFLQSFLKSKKYIELETQFKGLRKLDISNCFGNIYSHSISWATKPRKIVKEVISNGLPTGGFDTEFDLIMQKSNLNETNGIPVGAELSRIFAECILQKVDVALIDSLAEHKLILNTDYKVLRYLDDYFVYFNNKENADLIEISLARILRDFKLSLNSSKKEEFTKPFITSQTKSEQKIEELFVKIVLDINSQLDNKYLYLASNNLYKSILSKLRIEIDSFSVSYQDSSKFILKQAMMYLNSFTDKYLIRKSSEESIILSGKLVSTVMLITEVAFYFYSHDKRYQASTLLCRIIVKSFDIINNISNFYSFNEIKDIESKTMLQNLVSKKLISIINSTNLNSGTVELSNFLCLTKEIDSTYQISNIFLDKLIKDKGLNYFTIVSLLYLFEDNALYASKKTLLCKKIVGNILAAKGCREPQYKTKSEESEILHLFCDFMSCGYVDDKYKKIALKQFLAPIDLYDSNKVDVLLKYFSSGVWFVNWEEIDFRNFLRKKRLKSTY
jgi:hypothetical protein